MRVLIMSVVAAGIVASSASRSPAQVGVVDPPRCWMVTFTYAPGVGAGAGQVVTAGRRPTFEEIVAQAPGDPSSDRAGATATVVPTGLYEIGCPPGTQSPGPASR